MTDMGNIPIRCNVANDPSADMDFEYTLANQSMEFIERYDGKSNLVAIFDEGNGTANSFCHSYDIPLEHNLADEVVRPIFPAERCTSKSPSLGFRRGSGAGRNGLSMDLPPYGDPLANYLGAPAVEFEALRNVHFGIVLPKLRSMIPQKTWHSSAYFVHLPQGDNAYSRIYLGSLVLSMINNFAGLDNLPLVSIFDYTKARFTTEDIARFMASMSRPFLKAFSKSLLQCAILARDSVIVNFILSREDVRPGAHEVFSDTCGVAFTLWQQCMQEERRIECPDFLVPKLSLLKYGIAVSRSRLVDFEIQYLTKYPFLGRKDVNTVSFFLEIGAELTKRQCYEILRKLTTFSEPNAQLDMLRILLSQLSLHSFTGRRLYAAFQGIMPHLFKDSRRKIATVLIECGADLNAVLYDTDEFRTLIDAAAEVGDLELVQLLHSGGAQLTPNSLFFAMKSTNSDVVRYLLGAGLTFQSATSTHILEQSIHSTTMDILQILESSNIRPDICLQRKQILLIESACDAEELETVRDLLDSLSQEITYLDQRDLVFEPLKRKLTDAIDNCKEELACVLIDGGVCYMSDAHRSDEDWNPSLYRRALLTKSRKVLRKLIDVGHPGLRYSHLTLSQTPLGLAVRWGEVSIVKELLRAGADINELQRSELQPYWPSDRRCSALANAVGLKNTPLTKFLLNEGAAMDVPPSITPLTVAVRNQDFAMLSVLFACGATPDDCSALEIAVQYSHNCVPYLLHHFRQRYPHGRKSYGTRALGIAIQRGDLEMVDVLMDEKVDLGSIHPEARPTTCAILHANLETSQYVIPLLIKSGLNPNSEELGSDAPMLQAIEAQNMGVIQILLDHGADVNLLARRGFSHTPLQRASELGNSDLVDYLLQRGASVNAHPNERMGATALQFAAIQGYVGIAERLIEKGADINARGAKIDGRTAIEGAAEHGRMDMVAFLLHHGAVLDPRGLHSKCKSIRLAKHNGHRAIVEYLKSFLNKDQSQPAVGIESGGKQTRDRPICEHCQETFKNRSSLRRHNQAVHPSSNEEPKYRCTFSGCEKTFDRKDTFDRHVSTHTKANLVACQTCNQPFRKDYLKHYHLNKNGQCKSTKGKPR